MAPLEDLAVLTLAVNLPGPVAASRLREFGARVMKVEPPDGDPLARVRPDWYAALHEGQQVERLDLKADAGRERIYELLGQSDLFLTSLRPAALARLGLSWTELHARYSQLAQVAIVGEPSPNENRPGHDLTYQARWGLIAPPQLPRTLIADLAGAQEAVTAAIALLLRRERGLGVAYEEVSLAEAARRFAEPLQQGMTVPGGRLGGGFPGYNVYQCKQGWVAVAALEPHFWQRLQSELQVSDATQASLEDAFCTRTAAEWEQWAARRDLPVAAVCDVARQDT